MMKLFRTTYLALIAGSFFLSLPLQSYAAAPSSIATGSMFCEYLESPAGLDVQKPRFSWTLKATDDSGHGQAQSAYRIMVADSPQKNAAGNMWDTGWVPSDRMQLIEYAGKPLASDRTYYWQVQVKDENGAESQWSSVASWTTGLFDRSDWSAQWIGGNEKYDPSQPDGSISDPWLRKSVDIAEKPARAVMFVASVGYHELYVNGKKIGDGVLAPVVSDHSTRARYVTYDIAPALDKGKNVIALWLGASWSIYPLYQTDDKPQAPIVIAQVDIYTGKKITSGSKPTQRIVTDGTWKVHPSPNRLIGGWDMGKMGGEFYDANKEMEGWNGKEFDDASWTNASVYTPKLLLTAQNTFMNLKYGQIDPVGIEELADGSYRVDMGVNFAGWTEIRLKAEPGTRIDLLFSERRQDEMTFNLRSAYIMGPTGEGTFRNRFNYSSGRWITIKGAAEKPQLSDVRGWMVRTGYPSATAFECSDELQNWIYDRVRWTYENLSLGGYVVDCPQRERLGYGGDAHATAETGMFNYKLGSFYTKWMLDWRDMQGSGSNGGPRIGGGTLPHTAPTKNGGGGPSWGGIVVTLPWFMYQHEGDTRILEENFEMIDKWLEFLDSKTEDGILKRWGGTWDYLADWLWPGATAEGMNNNKPQAECFNSCYYAFNLATAAKIAQAIGKNDHARKWNDRADAVRKAVHAKYFNADDFSYSDRSMGNLALALIGEVPPPELYNKVFDRLEQEILVNCKGHIDVGITGGAMLFKLLREKGREDLVYSMTKQTDYPSWGHMRDNDATTIWEMWEKDLPGHSLLHSSYLYPGAWYIDGVAGIRRDAEHPGFKQFIVRYPLLKESEISWAKASFDSPAGMIESDWSCENGSITHKVTVPPNTKAKVYLPAKQNTVFMENSGYAKMIGEEGSYTVFEVPAGKYTFIEEAK